MLILFEEKSLQRGRCGGGKCARCDPLSEAARWLTQILQPRRMSIFIIRPEREETARF
jgi:hypothetical protein